MPRGRILAGMYYLGVQLVHGTLLASKTQQICHQSGPYLSLDISPAGRVVARLRQAKCRWT